MPPEPPFRLYTVYERPRDFPHSFVVRRWQMIDGESVPDALPLAVGPSLEAVRAALPEGLTNLGRDPRDEPQIVESWI